MRAVFENIIKGLDKSSPVFRIFATEDRKQAKCELVKKYNPKGTEASPIEKILFENFSEDFDKREMKFKPDTQMIISRARGEVMDAMIRFFEKNCGLKNPKQSKMHKFLTNYRRLDEGQLEGFLYLYEYLELNADQQQHIDNAMNVMEAMRRKYE
jgi:hypothetical protein